MYVKKNNFLQKGDTMSLRGVYITKSKTGKLLFRASLTHKRKHISLGTYSSETKAHQIYMEAHKVLQDSQYTISLYNKDFILPFEKYVSLVNLRENSIYFSNPIYLQNKFFLYYLSPEKILKFDLDDLFYYSQHKIMCRNRHLFVADYGSQISLRSRYGIRNYAVKGRDYEFINHDSFDFRYENIKIFNPFYGIYPIQKKQKTLYSARIHIRSYYHIGSYSSMIKAAIAYNKAVDILHQNGFNKNYPVNYIEEISPSKYADIYAMLKISPKIYTLKPI